MGSWGVAAFESDAALDFLDGVVSDCGSEGAAFAVTALALGGRTDEETHSSAELLAALMTDDWACYRVGGGSGLFANGKGDPRVWLPDEALPIVPVLRDGLRDMGDEATGLRPDLAALSDRLAAMSAEVLSSNRDGWTDPAGRSAALLATASRLRASEKGWFE